VSELLVHRSRDASNSREREFVRFADGCPLYYLGLRPKPRVRFASVVATAAHQSPAAILVTM
jgi:hypothetical protein